MRNLLLNHRYIERFQDNTFELPLKMNYTVFESAIQFRYNRKLVILYLSYKEPNEGRFDAQHFRFMLQLICFLRKLVVERTVHIRYFNIFFITQPNEYRVILI